MTILFCGGEDCDFSIVGAYAINTTAAAYRSTYARHNLRLTGGTSWSSSDGIFGSFPSALSEAWLSWRGYYAHSGSSSAQGYFLVLRDGTVNRILLGTDGASPAGTAKYRLFKRTAAGVETTLATSSGTISLTSLNKFDVYVNYGASGTFRLYVGGVLVIDYSGDLTTDGATTLSNFQFNYIAGAVSPSGSLVSLSEVIVADEDTRGMALATLTPLAAGNAQAWSGAVGDVNEAALSDASIISTTAADQLAQFTVTPGSAITSGTGIRAVSVNARAAKGASGPQNLQAVVRTGSTDYASSNLSVATALGRVANIWGTNPNTSVAWLGSDLLAAGFNIGLKSIT
jgi:hypothetical protein